MNQFLIRSLAAAMLVCCCAASPLLAPDTDEVDRRWLDQLDRQDRGYLEELVGYAPPPFTGELEWVGAEPMTWDDLRGRVVVIQSWTSKTTAGRKAPQRTAQSLDGLDAADVQVIALHTPEGSDTAATFLERRPMDHPAIVDSIGVFCDELGVYKRPVNIVVDRNGAVRYAGLNARGLKAAVEELTLEEYDAEKVPATRESSESAAAKPAAFPTFGGAVGPASDFRGQRAPNFNVEQWITANPLDRDKVVVIDFWATWCGPCVAAIPHMNELADEFSDDIAFIGISDEKPSSFQSGLQKRRLNRDSFHYALALDTSGKMKKAIQIRGIPHVIVISSDWVVRWQGHPATLNAQVLRQIVDANNSASGGGGGRNRWTGG